MDVAMRQIVTSAIAILLLGAIAGATQERSASATVGPYRGLVQRLFSEPTRPPGDSTLVVLQYLPTTFTEFQVAITTRPEEHTATIERWRLPDGSPTISEQLDEFDRTHPTLDLAAIASSIHIEHTKGIVLLGGNVGRVLARRDSLSFSLSTKPIIYLDGAEYLVRVRSGSTDIDLRVAGPNDPLIAKEPVIRWMGEVRRVLEHADISPTPAG